MKDKTKIKIVKDSEKRRIPIENVLDIDGVKVIYSRELSTLYANTFTFDFFVKGIDIPGDALAIAHEISDVLEEENSWQRNGFDSIIYDEGTLIKMHFKELV